MRDIRDLIDVEAYEKGMQKEVNKLSEKLFPGRTPPKFHAIGQSKKSEATTEEIERGLKSYYAAKKIKAGEPILPGSLIAICIDCNGSYNALSIGPRCSYCRQRKSNKDYRLRGQINASSKNKHKGFTKKQRNKMKRRRT